MGLDITHYKATFEKCDDEEFFKIGSDLQDENGIETKHSFKDFNVDFYYFEKYIQIIDIPKGINQLLIDLNKSNNLDYENEINDFEKRNNLNVFKKRKFVNSNTNLGTIYYYELEKMEAFYFKEVAYQRKGMNQEFYNKFCNGKYYYFALKEDFEYAFSCLDDKENSEKINYFKENFIDNYEHGSSFLSVSY